MHYASRILLYTFLFLSMTLGGCESTQSRQDQEEKIQKPSYLGIIFTEYYRGVRVVQVLDESPAARAGIKQGDVIVSLDGQAIAGKYSLQADIRERAPGTVIEIEVMDDSGVKTAKRVTLEEEPEGPILRPR